MSWMFRDCHDLEIHGDSLAYQKHQDWKDHEVIRKREKKELFKTQQMKLSEAEQRAKASQLPVILENQYIDACTKNLIEPKYFVRNVQETYPVEHYRAAVKKMGDMETYYQRIKNVQTDPPKAENPWATLKEYCETNSVAIEPIDCLRAINKVHHGRALRSAWRLLIRD